MKERYPGMRRAIVMLLLVLFSLPLITPALLARSNPSVPACCQRTGKHRCTMGSVPQPAGESLNARCHLYPRADAAPAFAKSLLIETDAAAAQHFFELVAAAPDHRGAPMALHGSPQKRGPPPAL